jgi:hypothetical protein
MLYMPRTTLCWCCFSSLVISYNQLFLKKKKFIEKLINIKDPKRGSFPLLYRTKTETFPMQSVSLANKGLLYAISTSNLGVSNTGVKYEHRVGS